ncbi:16S rRNA (guanine(527)-N(7))-methyltransferase RsmG [Plantactinospora sp. KLBMP9567]|uniref:16S rRNA (guanine(527)-N(7))-methyltransferase RsmG n=1 Tax=Plantactinospora sp. KLBMP9567 TaxID=3085900 RepID=UPI002981C3FA|nr:RsmG family class I SAM-dependent methyltransferase [Plantactinospora sp. KLBMP9567]MDW5328482.1 RsmG family class I SAM-dependent methyltransferase [Plantactinospora sp. KLBMP9567]
MTYRSVSGPGGEPPPGPSAVRAGGDSSPVVPLPAELAEPARTLFAERLPLAAAYAELLAGPGVLRGLIGPRETPRIWDRHLLNCAAVAELLPVGASVVDVGSGAGLPGIVLAIARPDLAVTLVEPLARRAVFLAEVVTALDLADTVTVVRARAEELAASRRASAAGRRRRAGRSGRRPLPVDPDGSLPVGTGGPVDLANLPAELRVPADVVTARAVAPLDRLAGWCLPLAVPGGRLLALKGASAAEEVAEHAETVRRLGGSAPVVRQAGLGVVDPPTTVVEVVREHAGRPAGPSAPGGRRGGAAR